MFSWKSHLTRVLDNEVAGFHASQKQSVKVDHGAVLFQLDAPGTVGSSCVTEINRQDGGVKEERLGREGGGEAVLVSGREGSI